jgi:purine catabolism regulator
MDWDKILRIIREKLGKLGNGVTATCAISNDVKNIMEIPHAYKTAQHLITLSRKIYGEGHTIRQKDAELYLILEKIDSISLSNSLLAPVLRSKKKDEYLLTLRTYLACDSNVSEAAEKLFIHRNTMQYRLKQIEKLIGQPMDSAETKTLLWLLLKAHELL